MNQICLIGFFLEQLPVVVVAFYCFSSASPAVLFFRLGFCPIGIAAILPPSPPIHLVCASSPPLRPIAACRRYVPSLLVRPLPLSRRGAVPVSAGRRLPWPPAPRSVNRCVRLRLLSRSASLPLDGAQPGGWVRGAVRGSSRPLPARLPSTLTFSSLSVVVAAAVSQLGGLVCRYLTLFSSLV